MDHTGFMQVGLVGLVVVVALVLLGLYFGG